MPLDKSWAGSQLVFEPRGSRWPEPQPDAWIEAVAQAGDLARAYFAGQGDKAALKRQPRTLPVAADLFAGVLPLGARAESPDPARRGRGSRW